MGSSFVLIKLTHEIDGRQVFERSDTSGKLDRTRELDAFSGTLPPGRHTLVVTAVYRGAAHGLFKYHESYRYRVRSEFVFTANPGQRNRITVEVVERGGASTKLADRPIPQVQPSVHRWPLTTIKLS